MPDIMFDQDWYIMLDQAWCANLDQVDLAGQFNHDQAWYHQAWLSMGVFSRALYNEQGITFDEGWDKVLSHRMNDINNVTNNPN